MGEGYAAISTRRLVGHSFALLRENIGLGLITVALLSGISIGLDHLAEDERGALLIIDNIAGLVAQYFLTRRLVMRRWEVMDPGSFAATFGVLFLSGLGIILGTLLLVLPGIFLLTRWYAAVPLVVGRNEGITDALRESWRGTAGAEMALLGMIVLLYAPMLTAMLLAVFAITWIEGDASLTVLGVTINVLISLTQVASWLGAIAFCELRGLADRGLRQIFM